MGKQRYDWWGYVKSLVRKYPENRSSELSGVALRNHEAVKKAVDATLATDGGADRLKVISMVHWERTRTLEGAASAVPCSGRTAAYWQREFFEETARNRDLLDKNQISAIRAKWIRESESVWICPFCFKRTENGRIYRFCPWCGKQINQ